MIDLKNAIVNRRVPKNRFRADLSSIDHIIWKYKLSKDTIGLQDNENYKEIQIFQVAFKNNFEEKSLIQIQKTIPYNIIFLVNNTYYIVIDDIVINIKQDLIKDNELNVDAYSINGILISIVEYCTGIKSEDISGTITKYITAQKLARKIEILNKRMYLEIQPKKKFEMHEEIKLLNQQLKELDWHGK